MDEFLAACGTPSPLVLEVEGPDGETRRWASAQPFALVGRQPGVDLLLEHEWVSRRHAYLQVVAGQLFCVDLGSRTAVHWAGGPGHSGWVDRGRGIRLGPFRIRAGPPLADDPRADDPLEARSLGDAPLPAVTLEFSEKGGRRPWPMTRVLTLVGRSTACRVRLEASAVSAFHCSLLRTPGGVWAVDLLGRGGIEVNQRRVRWARLEDGDRLQVGPARIRVRCERPSGAPGATGSGTLPALAPRPAVVARPSGPPSPPAPPDDPARVDLVEPILAHMTSRFGQMQQQMFDQFQQAMVLMAQTFGTLQRDQMAEVRAELERLRQVNQDLNALQAELSAWSAATATATAPDADASAALARIEALLMALAPRPDADAPPTAVAARQTQPNGTTAPDGPPTARNVPGPPHDEPPSSPSSSSDDSIHLLLHQRIAALQQERQGRWQRILGLMGGR